MQRGSQSAGTKDRRQVGNSTRSCILRVIESAEQQFLKSPDKIPNQNAEGYATRLAIGGYLWRRSRLWGGGNLWRRGNLWGDGRLWGGSRLRGRSYLWGRDRLWVEAGTESQFVCL